MCFIVVFVCMKKFFTVSYDKPLFSNTSLAPLGVWSWKMAKSTCFSSTSCECWSLASSTDSFSTLPACSSIDIDDTESSDVLVILSEALASNSRLTDASSIFIVCNIGVNGFVLSLNIPKTRCSTLTVLQERRWASSLLNAKTWETFGENWFIMCVFIFKNV